MKAKTLLLLLALFTAPAAFTDEVTLRCGLAGELQLEIQQEIFVRSREEAIAGRAFTMSFDFGELLGSGKQPVELTSVRGSYTAHGMNQRLPASHLAGTNFVLASDDCAFHAEEADGEIDLGPITDGGLVPAELLAGLLPGLPAESVSMGSTWVSGQQLKSLEGWAWAGGDISYENEVVDVQRSGELSVITVRTRGQTTIRAAEGHAGFVGEGQLDRLIEWSVDMATGKLLSFSLEQEASGINMLPQGEVPMRQRTLIRLVAS